MITYTKQTSLIEHQYALEKEFLDKFSKGDYSAKNPLVILNPYEISPLTAMIMFKTKVPQEVQVVIKGKTSHGDVRHTFPRAMEHILPIYGLYADYTNHVELILSGGEHSIIEIVTNPLPKSVPVPTFCKSNPEFMSDNWIFLTETSKADALACDGMGDVRWYLTINVCFDLKRLKNGHLLVGSNRLIKLPYYVSGVYEMGVNGKIYHEYRLPGGYHHDTFELENGNILMLSQIPDRDTVEDVLVLVDRKTGDIIKTYDYKKILPYNVSSTYSGTGTAHDWFHNNAVWYNKNDNSITLSGRHQDAVINIDFETGELNWIIGDPEGWPKEFVDKYFFKPIGSPFEWSYEQHGAVVCPNGDVMMFDNGHYRSKIKTNYMKAQDSYSRGVRYHLNLENRTIQQVWQFGKERGPEFFSPYICNVEYYDEGRYMVHSGGIAFENGEALEGLGSMDGGADCVLNAITCEIVDNEVVYELHVPSNAFRAEKLPPYYAGENTELGMGSKLGVMHTTQEFETELPTEIIENDIPEHYQASITEEDDRILFNATFEKGEVAMLTLEGKSGSKHNYFIDTSSGKSFEAMCVGTFLKNDPRNVDVYVNKQNLSGEMKVRLSIGNTTYDTGIIVNM